MTCRIALGDVHWVVLRHFRNYCSDVSLQHNIFETLLCRKSLAWSTLHWICAICTLDHMWSIHISSIYGYLPKACFRIKHHCCNQSEAEEGITLRQPHLANQKHLFCYSLGTICPTQSVTMQSKKILKSFSPAAQPTEWTISNNSKVMYSYHDGNGMPIATATTKQYSTATSSHLRIATLRHILWIPLACMTRCHMSQSSQIRSSVCMTDR